MGKISENDKQRVKKDRELGLTLYQLVEKYGYSKSTVALIIRDCDHSNVPRACPTRKVVVPVAATERPTLSKGDIGEAARQMICAKLMLNGVKVFRPVSEDTPIDLLTLRKDGAIQRCQCKYIYPEKTGNHRMSLCSIRKNNPRGAAKRHRYTLQEVDIFLGYCLDNDTVYVIPNAETGGRKDITLWVLRKSQGFNGHKEFNAQQWANRFDLL